MKLRTLALTTTLLLLAPTASADRLEQRFTVSPGAHLDIELVSGRVEISGVTGDEMHVRARGNVQIEHTPDFVQIRGTIGGPPWSWQNGEVRLEIEVPHTTDLTVRTVNGPIEVEDVDGRIELHAANGEIDVRGAPREAHLETLNARIEFEGDASSVFARTVNGEIELRGVARDVEASTMSGRIRVEGEDLDRVDLRTMSGEIELDGSLTPDARFYGKTYSGAVRLRLPEDTSARFEIESFSGRLESDFADLANATRIGQRLRARTGDGDARIAIDSFSGAVRIEADDDALERRRDREERRRERRRERAERRAEWEEEREERRRERDER